MPFSPKDWHDSPTADTPISAAALENLETRLSDYTDDEIAAHKSRLAVNVKDYPGTDIDGLVGALAAVETAGGGDIFMPPGIYDLPTNQTYQVAQSNVRLIGEPGQTILRANGTNGGGLIFGGGAYADAGNYRENIGMFGITLDMSAVTYTQSIGLAFGSIDGLIVEDVEVIGGTYPFILGGSGGYLPLKNARLTRTTVQHNPPGGGSGYAITNIDGLTINTATVHVLARNGSGSFAMDVEPNYKTDSLRGLRIKDFTVYGNSLGGKILLQGGVSDPHRASGIELDFTQIDCIGGVDIKVPGARVRGVQKYTRRTYPDTNNPSGGVHVEPLVLPADDVDVDVVVHNMSAETGFAAITLTDVSRCRVRRPTVIDTNNPANMTYVVKERQVNPAIVSGFATGTPSTMTIPLSAGRLQAANAGAYTDKAAQNATITTASAYDRVDLIVIDLTGTASVIAGTQPLLPGLVDPAASFHTVGSQIPVARVFVPANATSISQANISDARSFVPHDNEIDEPKINTALKIGSVKLISPTSRRKSRIPPPPSTYAAAERAYMRSVLSDAPLWYAPLLEPAGKVCDDLGALRLPGHYVGGVQLGKQIGATARYGAKLDGSTGFIQVPRLPLILNQAGSFTLEAQVLPDDFSAFRQIMTQGWTLSRDFTWWILDGTQQRLEIGGDKDVSSQAGTISSSTINHLAVDWSGTQVTFYVNGTAMGAAQAMTTPTYNQTAEDGYSDWPMVVGGAISGAVLPPVGTTKGFLRHVAIYEPNIGGTRIAAHAALM